MLFVPTNISQHDATKTSILGEVTTIHGLVFGESKAKKQLGTYNFVATTVGYEPKLKHGIVMFNCIIELGPKKDDSVAIQGQFELPDGYLGLQDAIDMDAMVVGGHGKYLGAFGNFIEKKLNKPGLETLADVCIYVPVM
jgi:hypothetical protein